MFVGLFNFWSHTLHWAFSSVRNLVVKWIYYGTVVDFFGNIAFTWIFICSTGRRMENANNFRYFSKFIFPVLYIEKRKNDMRNHPKKTNRKLSSRSAKCFMSRTQRPFKLHHVVLFFRWHRSHSQSFATRAHSRNIVKWFFDRSTFYARQPNVESLQ